MFELPLKRTRRIVGELASRVVSRRKAQQRSTAIVQKQGIIVSDVPQRIDAKALYLFYISGYLVEAGNTRPVSPKFGVYEYEQILDAFKQSGFVVISEARKQSPEIEPYAAKVAGQVRRLIEARVPPEQITVVGASQGSWIGRRSAQKSCRLPRASVPLIVRLTRTGIECAAGMTQTNSVERISNK
jgi:hypothetical protein